MQQRKVDGVALERKTQSMVVLEKIAPGARQTIFTSYSLTDVCLKQEAHVKYAKGDDIPRLQALPCE